MDKISEERFEEIKGKFGKVASWAVWENYNASDLTSNMEVDNVFDLSTNSTLLNQLQNDIIMVGYNVSIPTDNFPMFHNFHTYNGAKIHPKTISNASKIRYAFKDTRYYGAYMTDIIKNYVEVNSNKVKPSQKIIDSNFERFREELKILNAKKPRIIAFGGKVHDLLKRNLMDDEYSKLIKITHYSYFGKGYASHKDYRSKVLSQIKNAFRAG